ncbi:hypothetical protein A8F94_17410 [Bacillus sp. FJAT-27225]|nr:hypothetical protein A8F94_17410 [Bacillus sp. FJAT-27225]
MRSNFKKVIDESPYKPAAIRDYMGVHRNTFSNWMTGKHIPSVEDLFKIARFIGRKVDDFYEWEEENE